MVPNAQGRGGIEWNGSTSWTADWRQASGDRALTEKCLTYIGANPTVGNGTLLTCIVREMIDQGKRGQSWSGVHVGFLAELNRYARAAARVVTPPKPERPHRPKLRLVRNSNRGQS